jgi:RHS repeat-associated protein
MTMTKKRGFGRGLLSAHTAVNSSRQFGLGSKAPPALMRRSSVMRAGLLACFIAGVDCSGSSSSSGDGETSVRATHAALTSAQAEILGFENLADWTQTSGTATLALSTDHVEGASSLAVSNVTSSVLKSATFAPISGGFSNITVAVENPPPNPPPPSGTPPRTGTLSLTIHSSSGQPASAVIGEASVPSASTFQTLSFAVPTWINDTLTAQGGSSVYFTIELNFSAASSIKLDALTPTGAASNRPAAPFTQLPTDAQAILSSATAENPTAAGRISGSSGVDSSGAFTYDVPFDLPEGRAGMQPHLGLHYSSSAGNGPVGVGWGIAGLSSIARCPRTVAREGDAQPIKTVRLTECGSEGPCPPQFTEYNTLIDNFCLDGQKLVQVGGTSTNPEFRTERDSFSKIIATYSGDFWPSKFMVWRKDGTIATYLAGSVADGFETLDANGQTFPGAEPFQSVLSWPIGTLEDRFGNAVSYSYVPGDEDSAANLLDTVRYTTCVSGCDHTYGAETRLVKFNYTSRGDFISAWSGGLSRSISQLLSSVGVYTLSGSTQTAVRSYELGYDTSGATARSRLVSLTEKDAQGVPMPATIFSWGGGKGTDFRRTWHVVGPDPANTVATGQCSVGTLAPDCFWAQFEPYDQFPNGVPQADQEQPMLIGDFDGNGSDDVIAGLNDEEDTNQATDYWLFLSHPAHGTATFEKIHLGTGLDFSESQAVDIDQDGTAEIVKRFASNDQFSNNPVYRYQPAIHNFAKLLGPDGTTPYTIATTGYVGLGNPAFMDANGDGVLDILYDSGISSQLPGSELDHSYQYATANPGANSLFPTSYGAPLEVFWGPNETDQSLYAQGLCHLEPVDYAGRGAQSPAVVCDDQNRFTRFADMNGDGLADMLQLSVGPQPFVRERLSIGVQRIDDNGQDAVDPGSQMLAPITLATTDFANAEVDGFTQKLNQTADFNGDGLTDIVQFAITGSKAPVIWLSSGATPLSTQLTKIQLPKTGDRVDPEFQKTGDFNGDGLPDLVQGIDATGVGDNNLVQRVVLQFLIQDPSNRDDVLTGVTSDSVPLAKVTYKAATTLEISPHPDDLLPAPISGVFNPTRGLNVVSHADLLKGTAVGRYDYFYSQPVADTSGRGFLGFSQIITADVARAARITTTYENTRIEGSLHGYHLYPYAFVPQVVETLTRSDALAEFDLGGNAASPIILTRDETSTSIRTLHLLNSADGNLSATSTYFIEDSGSSNVKDDENNTTYYTASRSGVSYDDFGNITGYTATSGPETAVNTTSYFNDSSANWLIGRPHVSQTTTSRSGAATGIAQNPDPAVTTYTYGSVGELTSVQYIGPTGTASEVDTAITRDSAGLIRSVVAHDQAGDARANSVDFSPDGIYRQHTQDALGHDTWTGYHPGLGVPLISVDPNGRQTLYQYDGFGRPRTVTPARGTVTSTTYDQGGGSLAIITSANPGTTIRKQFDQLGNLTAESTVIGGRTSLVSTDYDGLGRVQVRHQPYFIDGPTPSGNTIYTYDNLNEIRLVQEPDGSTVTINRPDVLTKEVISNGNPARRTVTTSTSDGLVSSVREYSSTGNGPAVRGLDYAYGQGQTLEQVSELNGGTTTYVYNGLPKPIEISTPDRGHSIITYTGFNDVSHVENTGDNSTLDYAYDALGRTTKLSTHTPSATPQDGVTSYVYDTGAGAVGQLAFATSPDGISTRYAYTPEGLLAEAEDDGLGSTYITDYTYDPNNGRLNHIDYPDPQNGLGRFGIDFHYDGGDGSLQSVTRNTSSGTTTYWSALSRGPTGIAEDANLLGGLTQSLTIDPNTRQLRGVSINSAAATVYDVEYAYYSGGDIQQRTDGLAGTTDTYTYDGYDQLLSWTSNSAAGASTENYIYDGLGNQTSTGSVTKTFGGVGLSPHQVASRSVGTETRSYGYDFLGRRTSMSVNGVTNQTVNYTAFDLPSKIVNSSPARTHTYKYAAQRKFDENDGTFETTYSGNLFERRLDNAACKTHSIFYVYAEGQRIAQVEQVRKAGFCIDANTGKGTVNIFLGSAAETTRLLHVDLQGSPTAASTITPTLSTSRQAFSPWGDRLPLVAGATSSSIDQVTVGYTDQEEEDSVGLINMQGRMFDPSSRTFLTPDPLVGRPTSVASWNAYAYVLNNPLKYVDPSGYDLTITDGTGYGISDLGGGNEGIRFLDPNELAKAHVGSSTTAFDSNKLSGAGNSPVTARGADNSNTQNPTSDTKASGTDSPTMSDGNSTNSDAPLGAPTAPVGAPDSGSSSATGAPADSSFNAGSSTSENSGPSLAETTAGIGLGFIPFASELYTINSDRATDSEKGWALVSMLVTAATLGASTEIKGLARAAFAAEDAESGITKGGTYLLRDAETGTVTRTGRTNDLARRAAEHARDPALEDFEFEVVHRTDNYAEQRGLEQYLHNLHDPPLNKVRPISPLNPNGPGYMRAAQRFLGLE